MLPDTRQGEALLAIVDTGSFEQAAALLHISPSAISQRVAALEAAAGAPLLVRSRPCRPTAAGQRLVSYLRRSRLLEEEYLADLADQEGRPLSVPLAVNNDTLATWLLPELTPFLARENLLLDIALDDQDHTYNLLERGVALAAVSTEAQPMRGCTVQPLGVMRYRMLASPAFAARWFPGGLSREAARKAPLLVFDRKDMLQAVFLQRELGLPPGSYPCHYIPSSDAFLNAILLGLGYGMSPEQQYGGLLEQATLLDVAPGRHIDVALHWHSWRVQSPKLERLSAEVIAAARRRLTQAPTP
ncbi:LysR family transcriptional regulator ArgP [Pseudoduganella namucuonensis]|uniref:Transcriptional regulator, LysR family n=1 Tax=Pseudoduganella namucuonensis TaxID=1035707 RepID=A0A1I7JQE0_9BURK|nr:LysR family transcriptional regulator ArgP [Pseudoduganella namucuonensis]SFU87409.1 transcriptional regulator, LysR family [Pseudoduganella namucuonensis]